MPTALFYILFGVTWLTTVAYALSAFRMGFRLYRLKKQGRFPEAPDLMHPLEGPRAIGWLLSGRYAELDDPIISRWARIARILFFVAVPLMLTVFVMGFGVVRTLP